MTKFIQPTSADFLRKIIQDARDQFNVTENATFNLPPIVQRAKIIQEGTSITVLSLDTNAVPLDTTPTVTGE